MSGYAAGMVKVIALGIPSPLQMVIIIGVATLIFGKRLPQIAMLIATMRWDEITPAEWRGVTVIGAGVVMGVVGEVVHSWALLLAGFVCLAVSPWVMRGKLRR
jgi:vacuolar-type H+-ATPase subunit I/STV1